MKYLFTSLLFFMTLCCINSCETKKEVPVIVEPIENLEILVGTYTGQGSDGIFLLSFNPETGTIENKGLVAKTENPSYLTISQNLQKVYVVNELENGTITSFQWNMDRTQLDSMSTASTSGMHPCYVDLNSDETMIAVGNYSSGNIALFATDSAAGLNPVAAKQHVGKGGNPERQDAPHAHCARFSKKGVYLYAVDLGIDQVVKYPISGSEVGDGATAFVSDSGDGPRHLEFHPTKDIAFVINELSSSVVSVKINTETGDFTAISKVSTLPADFTGDSNCADIHISDDGLFLYASNRGHNSIAVFIVAEDGALTLIANESVQGDWPRNFTLSPDNKFIVVANQKSNNVTVFSRNAETGLLTYTGNQASVSQPVCVKF